MEAHKLIQESRKIVVKVGSNTLAAKNGLVDLGRMENMVNQICAWMKEGKRVIVVSSGAGICGTAAINKWHRKNDINYKQALCAIGQVELMNAYKNVFDQHGVHVGQMLLTREDFEDQSRNLHIRNTLLTLVDEGVVPIINENDSVSVEEIKIGDNDTLAALTANLWGADLLVLLSDIDGVYDKDPKKNPDAQLIPVVEDAAELSTRIDVHGVSDFGTGGIATKLSAACKVNAYGIPMVLANGSTENILKKLCGGEVPSTVFLGK
ncbi:MAG: glutamate 5-kinase [Clostridiales bacterium]|nr:glutamate 5-kinase [Clostridiales bacterium]